MPTPEEQARQTIDRLFTAAGWAVQDVRAADIHAARGVAIREFPLDAGFGFADYLLYVDGKAAGVIEAKKQGATLTGVEVQSGKYAQGLPAWRRPLSFIYESTGAETHFTNALDPEPLIFAKDDGANSTHQFVRRNIARTLRAPLCRPNKGEGLWAQTSLH